MSAVLLGPLQIAVLARRFNEGITQTTGAGSMSNAYTKILNLLVSILMSMMAPSLHSVSLESASQVVAPRFWQSIQGGRSNGGRAGWEARQQALR